ncbi:hypothetical protein LY78DRAFT_193642 [Colletotrichum sublineola]|nr:hypothetical protein LY78DRAFT_193642 [Colletotrichum sublineola]
MSLALRPLLVPGSSITLFCLGTRKKCADALRWLRSTRIEIPAVEADHPLEPSRPRSLFLSSAWGMSPEGNSITDTVSQDKFCVQDDGSTPSCLCSGAPFPAAEAPRLLPSLDENRLGPKLSTMLNTDLPVLVIPTWLPPAKSLPSHERTLPRRVKAQPRVRTASCGATIRHCRPTPTV